MDPDYLHERVTEIYGTKITLRSESPLGCFIAVDARVFRRLIYREANRPDLLVEQTVYSSRGGILNEWLPQSAKDGRARLRTELLLRPPELEDAGEVLARGPSVSFFADDVNWNNISQALARYAEDSDAFIRNSSRRLHSLRADVARGKVLVMTPELGWDRRYYEDPVGDVHDTSCVFCGDEYIFQNPNHFREVAELACRHVFHKTCLYKWVWIKKTSNNGGDNNPRYFECPTCSTFIT